MHTVRTIPTMLALLLAAGCGAGSPSASPSGAPAAHGATPMATPMATPSPGPSATASPASPSPAPRAAAPVLPHTATSADLERALLEPADVDTGYAVGRPELGLAGASSTRPACQPLVAVLDHVGTGAGAVARSVSTAGVVLDGGADAPLVQERLDGFDRPLPAITALSDEVYAARACPEVTVRVPHYGRAAFSVAQVTIATVGKGSYALRLSALPDELDGLEIVVAAAVVDGVDVHLVTDADAEDTESVLQDAADKVHDMISAADGGTPDGAGSGTGSDT